MMIAITNTDTNVFSDNLLTNTYFNYYEPISYLDVNIYIIVNYIYYCECVSEREREYEAVSSMFMPQYISTFNFDISVCLLCSQWLLDCNCFIFIILLLLNLPLF